MKSNNKYHLCLADENLFYVRRPHLLGVFSNTAARTRQTSPATRGAPNPQKLKLWQLVPKKKSTREEAAEDYFQGYRTGTALAGRDTNS
jgi:hypothetical protein